MTTPITAPTTTRPKPPDDNGWNASQTKILKNLAHRLSDDYFMGKKLSDRAQKQDQDQDQDQDKDDIDQYITSQSQQLWQSSTGIKYSQADESNDREFDGLNDPLEEKTVLIEKVKHLERQNLKLKHQLELAQTDFDTEKKHLNQTIKDLKSELHRTAPLTQNKFFTFSKDLRAVVEAVHTLAEEEEPVGRHLAQEEMLTVDLTNPLPIEQAAATMTEPSTTSIKQVSKPKEEDVAHPANHFPSTQTNKPAKTKKIKKTLIAIAVATITTAGIGLSLLSLGSNNQREASPQGQVGGVSDDNPNPTPSAVSTAKPVEFKYNQVSLAETSWETFRDEFLGFQVKYPANTTDILHTGNTITWLRKDGYIFKMQRIKTNDTLAEYWQKTKTIGLSYQESETKLGVLDAYLLTLEEEADFPGNRYLVKHNDHVFDIWFATESDKFDQDDLERVKVMIESIRIL